MRLALFALLAHSLVHAAPGPPPVIDHANWMRDLMPLIANATLLDLSIPGTHDSMTVDLGNVVADGAEDIPTNLSYILHDFGNFENIGQFARNQSITQGLNITQQLDSGMRFIDFRLIYTRAADSLSESTADWYCLHFTQTQSLALSYLSAARAWLDEHPAEILTFWFSKHGSECTTTYPGVPQSAMLNLWSNVTSIFQGLMFDSSVHSLNTTTISSLLAASARAVFLVSPFNFTGNSVLALDGCASLDNDISHDFVRLLNMSITQRALDKSENKLYLASLSGGWAAQQMFYAFLIETFPALTPELTPPCINVTGVVNMTTCPLHLMDGCLLGNYLNQPYFEAALTPGYDLPGAIYLDGLDINGTIRTGPQLFGPAFGGLNEVASPGVINGTAKYAYVDAMLLATVRRLCGLTGAPGYGPDMLDEFALTTCDQYITTLQAQRALYPLQQWVDASTGRFLLPPVF